MFSKTSSSEFSASDDVSLNPNTIINKATQAFINELKLEIEKYGYHVNVLHPFSYLIELYKMRSSSSGYHIKAIAVNHLNQTLYLEMKLDEFLAAIKDNVYKRLNIADVQGLTLEAISVGDLPEYNQNPNLDILETDVNFDMNKPIIEDNTDKANSKPTDSKPSVIKKPKPQSKKNTNRYIIIGVVAVGIALAAYFLLKK